MSRVIIVGDPHVRPGDLDDARDLLDYVTKLATEKDAGVLLLGDLYHHHGIIHAEVMRLWYDFFVRLESLGCSAVSLVGNHDMPGVAGSNANALLAHIQECTVISRPKVMGNILFVPYCSNEELIAACNAYPHIPTVVCHATFNGSKYENGMYAKDGVDPELLPQKLVISGHIHTPQGFGKVWHPGAPRALTVADANVTRAVWLVEFDAAGGLVSRAPYPLNEVCRQVLHFEDSPATPLELNFNPRHKYHVDISGPAEWINKRKPLFEGKARIRTFRTDHAVAKVKESEGISTAFRRYFDSYRPQFGTDPAALHQLLTERINGINP